jgi:hypothetical protein
MEGASNSGAENTPAQHGFCCPVEGERIDGCTHAFTGIAGASCKLFGAVVVQGHPIHAVLSCRVPEALQGALDVRLSCMRFSMLLVILPPTYNCNRCSAMCRQRSSIPAFLTLLWQRAGRSNLIGTGAWVHECRLRRHCRRSEGEEGGHGSELRCASAVLTGPQHFCTAVGSRSVRAANVLCAWSSS